MKDRLLKDAWVRKLDGQSLSDDEKAVLLAMLRANSPESIETTATKETAEGDATALRHDLEIDAMLTAAYELDSETFLDEFQRRFQSDIAESRTKPPIQPPPIVEKPSVTQQESVSSIEEYVDPRTFDGSNRANWISETPWIKVTVLALTILVLFVLTPLVIVSLQGTRMEVNGTLGDVKDWLPKNNDQNVDPLLNDNNPDVANSPNNAKPPIKAPTLDPNIEAPEENLVPETPLVEKPNPPLNPPSNPLSPTPDPLQPVAPVPKEEIVQVQPKPLVEKPEVVVQTSTYASLVSEKETRWANGYKPDKQFDSQALSLESGEIEIQMNSGTSIKIMGPAQWMFGSENSLVADRGQFIADVPKKAIGFAITTPGSTIVDLGTVFQTDIAADRSTKVKVVSGKIELTTKKSKTKKPQNWQLTTGESKWISPTGDKTLDWSLDIRFGAKGKEDSLMLDEANFDLREGGDIRDAISLINKSFASLSHQFTVKKDFSAEIRVNGIVTELKNAKQVGEVQIELMLEVQGLWMKAMLN